MAEKNKNKKPVKLNKSGSKKQEKVSSGTIAKGILKAEAAKKIVPIAALCILLVAAIVLVVLMVNTNPTAELVIKDDVLVKYSGSESVYTVPEGITEIGETAFNGNYNLSVVIIPEGVTEIGYAAFVNCRNLTQVVLPASLKTIAPQAFYNCSSLTTVQFADNSALTELMSETFAGCTSLKKITLPASLKTIGEMAFSSSSSTQPCTALETVILPEGLEIIGAYAFSGCANLRTIEFGENIKEIQDYAFAACASLRNVSFNKNTDLGYAAFSGCTSLYEAKLPENMKVIKAELFSGCTSLQNIEIPSGVAMIEEKAFFDTKWDIKQIDDYVIVGDGVLYACNIVADEITIPESVDGITIKAIASDAFHGASSKDGEKAYKNIVIPNSITLLGSGLFSSLKVLESATLPEGLTEIPMNMFYQCFKLENVNIPSGVTSIGAYAFFDCNALEDISVPSGVTYVGAKAFRNTPYFAKHTEQFFIVGDGVLVQINPTVGTTELTIPNNVKYIASEAGYGSTAGTVSGTQAATLKSQEFEAEWRKFSENCGALSVIRIPASVTTIDGYAFQNVNALKTVEIAENSALKTIESYAFAYCSNLASINIPGTVETIRHGAFYLCSSLTKVAIPESIKTIGVEAFAGCALLTEINIPNTVETIGDEAFAGCTGLKKATLGEGFRIRQIPIFYGCGTKLEKNYI